MNIAIKSRLDERFLLKVDAMISVIEKLCAVLEKENLFLENNKVKNVEKLIDPKIKLINIYTEKYNSLTSDKENFAALDNASKDELKKSAIKLQSLMEKNERLLGANINSTKRLIDMIVTDAKKYENEQSGVYSAMGKMGHESKKGANLTFNQVL